MSYLLDFLEDNEIVFTHSPLGTRAWKNVRGQIVEVEVSSAIKAKRDDDHQLARPLLTDAHTVKVLKHKDEPVENTTPPILTKD